MRAGQGATDGATLFLILKTVLAIAKRYTGAGVAEISLTLPFELRQKSRLRTQADNGEIVTLLLDRGSILRGRDLLEADDGRIVAVVAANERVMTVQQCGAKQLLQAAYHLGNRHVPLQIGDGWVRFGSDAVLAEMLDGLGIRVVEESAQFEPEAGAYGGGHRHVSESHAPAIHRHFVKTQ